VVFAMDVLPHQIIRSVLLGQQETVLSSKTIWVCASCETCTTRCPNEIDIAKVMDVLRQIQIESGKEAKEPKAPVFHKTFLNSIKNFGRIHELSLMANFMRKSGGIGTCLKWRWKNDLRWDKNVFAGKLEITSYFPKGTGEYARFQAGREHKKIMNVTFFPGCSLEGTARKTVNSIEAIAHMLGITLEELPAGRVAARVPAQHQ
jgi:heterodisulfide reductase subunit C